MVTSVDRNLLCARVLHVAILAKLLCVRVPRAAALADVVQLVRALEHFVLFGGLELAAHCALDVPIELLLDRLLSAPGPGC